MTNRDNILSTLSSAELCDDCLSAASGIKPRQAINTLCRDLAASNIVMRRNGKCERCRKAKLVNRLSDEQQAQLEVAPSAPPTSVQTSVVRAWYWEGNVQEKVVSHLMRSGYLVRSLADTASREAGKDIIAVAPDGNELWVSVKGYPERSRNVQARHWFSGAVFDLVLYRGQSPSVTLALALPDGFTTYTNLLPRINWLKSSMQFQVFWVDHNGNVRVE